MYEVFVCHIGKEKITVMRRPGEKDPAPELDGRDAIASWVLEGRAKEFRTAWEMAAAAAVRVRDVMSPYYPEAAQ